MNPISSVSQKGLERVFGHEGVVPGIYDCPAGHATFGMGTLVHEGPSRVLDVVVRASALKANGDERQKAAAGLGHYVKVYRPAPGAAGVTYLDVEVGQDKTYAALIRSLLAGSAAGARAVLEQENGYLERGWKPYLADFRARIRRYEQAVSTAFPGVPLTQEQFDGLFSLAYNIGVDGLLKSKELIRALKAFVAATRANAPESQRHHAADALLESILRARPTAAAAVTGEVDGVTFRLTEPGVFNSGLFNRRIAEAGMIIGRRYSTKDAEIRIARKLIKAEKDHETTERAKKHGRAIVDGLNAIGHINRGW